MCNFVYFCVLKIVEITVISAVQQLPKLTHECEKMCNSRKKCKPNRLMSTALIELYALKKLLSLLLTVFTDIINGNNYTVFLVFFFNNAENPFKTLVRRAGYV